MPCSYWHRSADLSICSMDSAPSQEPWLTLLKPRKGTWTVWLRKCWLMFSTYQAELPTHHYYCWFYYFLLLPLPVVNPAPTRISYSCRDHGGRFEVKDFRQLEVLALASVGKKMLSMITHVGPEGINTGSSQRPNCNYHLFLLLIKLKMCACHAKGWVLGKCYVISESCLASLGLGVSSETWET